MTIEVRSGRSKLKVRGRTAVVVIGFDLGQTQHVRCCPK